MPFDDYALAADRSPGLAGMLDVVVEDAPPAALVGVDALVAELDRATDDLAPNWASLADIETNPPPPRRWVLDQWLPFGAPTYMTSPSRGEAQRTTGGFFIRSHAEYLVCEASASSAYAHTSLAWDIRCIPGMLSDSEVLVQ